MKNLFFYQQNLCDALSFAQEVAKQIKGKIATLPDLISLRASSNLGDLIWERWITPLTTIYFGIYKGKKLIVVAHHLGPLNTKERIEKWSKSGSNDKGSTRLAYGEKGLPKITYEEFKNLVEGNYGEVSVLDFEEYWFKNLDYTLLGNHIEKDYALEDVLLNALCGKDFKAFVKKHFEISSKYALEKHKEPGSEQKILELKIKDVYGWPLFTENHYDFPKKGALALFLTLGRPSFWGNRDLSISTPIIMHDDLGSARFLVINNPKDKFVEIEYSPGKHYEKCLVKSYELISEGSCLTLMRENGNLFVEYPKEGARMDTGEIKFLVTNSKKIGKPTFFKTRINHSPFLRYSIDEVREVMPPSANAYEIIGGVDPGDIVQVPVQFYHVEVDTSQRILRREEVMCNLPILLEINNISLKGVSR